MRPAAQRPSSSQSTLGKASESASRSVPFSPCSSARSGRSADHSASWMRPIRPKGQVHRVPFGRVMWIQGVHGLRDRGLGYVTRKGEPRQIPLLTEGAVQPAFTHARPDVCHGETSDQPLPRFTQGQTTFLGRLFPPQDGESRFICIDFQGYF